MDLQHNLSPVLMGYLVKRNICRSVQNNTKLKVITVSEHFVIARVCQPLAIIHKLWQFRHWSIAWSMTLCLIPGHVSIRRWSCSSLVPDKHDSCAARWHSTDVPSTISHFWYFAVLNARCRLWHLYKPCICDIKYKYYDTIKNGMKS